MNIKIVVAVSGGKDSQACLKMAVSEVGADHVLGVFYDTQFEHPLTYAHIENLKTMYGVNIETVTTGSVDDQVLKFGRFPGNGVRHCTDRLKLQPSKHFYKRIADEQGRCLVYLGMRLDESTARRDRYKNKKHDDVYAPHEIMPSVYPKYLSKAGVMFKLPILEWSYSDVMDYLNGEHNPLYDSGFKRVGCFPCLAGGDPQKEKAFSFDDFGRSQRIRVRNLEDAIGKSIFTSKGGSQRNNENQLSLLDGGGCAICSI